MVRGVRAEVAWPKRPLGRPNTEVLNHRQKVRSPWGSGALPVTTTRWPSPPPVRSAPSDRANPMPLGIPLANMVMPETCQSSKTQRVTGLASTLLRRCERTPGQVGDLPHDTGKWLMWRRPPACVADRPNEAGISSQLLRERITNSSASPEARRSIRLSMFFIAFGGRSDHANTNVCATKVPFLRAPRRSRGFGGWGGQSCLLPTVMSALVSGWATGRRLTPPGVEHGPETEALGCGWPRCATWHRHSCRCSDLFSASQLHHQVGCLFFEIRMDLAVAGIVHYFNQVHEVVLRVQVRGRNFGLVLVFPAGRQHR